ncbi:MAG: acyl-CoA synthetase [Desulfovermiculus sp.]|nr:acyl-CoA synthetase [Desulfovermiculus sp.]
MYSSTFTGKLYQTTSKYKNKYAFMFFRQGQVETKLSFSDLDIDTNKLANYLFYQYDVKKNDRVLLYLPKSIIFVNIYFAIQKIGAIAVPLNPEFKMLELTYFVNNSDPKLIVTGLEQEHIMKSINSNAQTLSVDTNISYQGLQFFQNSSDSFMPVQLGMDDPALIIYTSGTTGKPKGAVLTHRNLVSNAENIIQVWDITKQDVMCHVLPLFHAHGLCFALHAPFLAGATIILLDRFQPESTIELLSNKEKYRCSMFMAVPTIYQKLLEYLETDDTQHNFEHIRLMTSGSAPLLPKDFKRIEAAFGHEPVEREGMTETNLNFTNPVHGTKKPGSIGMPIPELEVRIVDPETLNDVEQDQEGELWLRGPNISPGYWRDPEETDKAFYNGWFRTGDLGSVDKEGYYYLSGRLKDIIISGGENISPKEVEDVINQYPGVLESAVLGVPDEKFGERVVAVVVKRDDREISIEEMQNYCRKQIHKWKCPKEFLYVENLPKNIMGKVLKEELKESFL